MQNIDYDLRSVQEVRDLARLGQIATEKIANYTEDQIDRIIRNMVRVAEENAVSLAQMAVEETGFGKVADKTYKNHMASTLLYDAIKDMKTIGIISEDPITRTMDVADPVGLLMGIVPPRTRHPQRSSSLSSRSKLETVSYFHRIRPLQSVR